MPAVVSSGRARAAFGCVVAALVTAALLAGFAVLLFSIVLQPALPEYTVNSATAADLSFTNATVSANFGLDVVSYNPNSAISVLYDRTEFHVLYSGAGREEELTAASHDFRQRQLGPKETLIFVRAVAQSTPVTDSAVQSLKEDVAAGEVPVNVLIRARVRFQIAGFTTWRFHLRAFCSDVVIDLSVPAFQEKDCVVEVY